LAAQIPVRGEGILPVEVTSQHRATSAEVLGQLARRVSSPHKAGRELHVRIGHYDQPGFLNPSLFGFWIMPLTSTEVPPVKVAGLDEVGMSWAEEEMKAWASPQQLRSLITEPAAVIQSPNESTIDSPSLWACVLNTSVENQVESTLISLAMLIARQELVLAMPQGDITVLPDKAARVDAETIKLIGDEVRIHGWTSAAETIRARADASGCSLHVEYRNPLMDLSAARSRMPLARHLYNTVPTVKDSIDRIVGLLTQGWTISGPMPEQILQRTRDAFEASGIPSLTAHCARDAFVCGVGVLSLVSAPLRNPWLLLPEQVDEVNGDSATQSIDGRREILHPVLSMTGAAQLDSTVPLSLLEPLMLDAVNRANYISMLLSARIIRRLSDSLPRNVTNWAVTAEPFAAAQLGSMTTTESVFHPTALKATIVGSLYSAGFELMEPAVSRIVVGN